jgi:hypothetical protein
MKPENKENAIVVSHENYSTIKVNTETLEKYEKDPEFRTIVSNHLKAHWIAKSNLLKLGITVVID